METLDFNNSEKVVFSPGIDCVSFEKNAPFWLLRKTTTGKKGINMVLFFFAVVAAIVIFSKTWYVPLLASLIFASAVFTVFFSYSILIDFSANLLSLRYRYLFFSRKVSLPFADIKELLLKDGETGFSLLILRGPNQTLWEKVKNQLPLCRLAKGEEAEAFYYFIKQSLLGKSINA